MVLANHHALAQEIHHRRADLRNCIQCIRIRKWPQKRIAFRTVAAGKSQPRRIRVEGGCAMARHG